MLVTGFIVYGSLYPFVFRPDAGTVGPVGYLLSTWKDWDARGDLLSNILLYIPFGFLLTHTLPARLPVACRGLLAIAAGAALATCMELGQFYDQGRVTSLGDVYANAIGSAVGALASAIIGASMRWPFVRELSDSPDASMLLTMFLAYRLYPYVPVIDLHKYWHAVAELVSRTVPSPGDLARFVVIWLFVATVIEALYGFRRWILLFPLFVLATFAGRILVIDLSLTSADVIGAAIVCVLWVGPLRWLPARPVAIAVLFAGMITALRLAPFTFSPLPLRPFGWVPFLGMMHGSISVAMQAFCEKFYQYGGLIWLFNRTGLSLGRAACLVGTLLFATSYAEVYLPDRSAEITDAVMAVVVGGAFWLLREAVAKPWERAEFKAVEPTYR
jgi:VanZ family protein